MDQLYGVLDQLNNYYGLRYFNRGYSAIDVEFLVVSNTSNNNSSNNTSISNSENNDSSNRSIIVLQARPFR